MRPTTNHVGVPNCGSQCGVAPLPGSMVFIHIIPDLVDGLVAIGSMVFYFVQLKGFTAHVGHVLRSS